MANKILIILFFCFGGSLKQAAQTNIDFEQSIPGAYTTSNAVGGWTVESCTNNQPLGIACTGTSSNWVAGSPEFSVLTTPIIGSNWNGISPFSIDNVNILNSPLGGTNVVRLQKSTNSVNGNLATRIRTKFNVTSANSNFQFSYAGSWDGSTHACCDQPCSKIQVYDCLGVPISAFSVSLTPSGNNCSSGVSGYSITAGVSWCNWITNFMDFSPYIGSCVTVEIISSHCNVGNHHGSLYFDAQRSYNLYNILWNGAFSSFPTSPVSFCSGTNMAKIIAPFGYASYQWFAPGSPPVSVPPISGGNTQTLTINNPLAGTIYTVSMVTYGGFSVSLVDTLKYTSVSIAAIGTNSACGTAGGSASIFASGSPSGYNYTWFGPGSPNPISSTSTITNVAPGIYTVNVSALGCGSTSATVIIGTKPLNIKTTVVPFCANSASLTLSTVIGSSYQWYNASTPISSALGGTNQAYTVNTPTANQIFWARSTSTGCKDSTLFLLTSMPLGNLQVVSNATICQGSNTGVVVLKLNNYNYGFPSTNSFSVFTVPSSNQFSATPSPGPATTFSLICLSSDTIYRVDASDGYCQYTRTFTPNIYKIDFILSPAPASTVCSGNILAAVATFTLPGINPLSFMYNWQPTTFLSSPNSQSTIITPTAAPGTISTIVYSVTLAQSIFSCSDTKTMSVTHANLLTPTISAIPALCKNNSPYNIIANPPGGLYTFNGGGSSNGVISPLLSNTGLNTFTYAISTGTCVNSTVGFYTVNALPVLSISGITEVCYGQTTTLTAGGANSYSWSTGATSSVISFTPNYGSYYTLTGTSSVTSCSATNSIYMLVHPPPSISTKSLVSICEGESVILIADGPNYFKEWVGLTNEFTVSVAPLSNSTYTFVGFDDFGCSSSKTVTVSVSACTAIDELGDQSESIKIYPNPFADFLTVELTESCHVTIYDLTGKIIFERKMDSGLQSINIKVQNEGIYFLKIIGITKSKVFKVVKVD